MKEKINQKGFIQIPLLIGIIVVALIASGGTGVILYKQSKTRLTANVFEALNQRQNTPVVAKGEEQTNQEQLSGQSEELEQAKLEAEKAKLEAEKLKKEAEETKRKAEEEARIKTEQELQQQLETQRLAEEQRKQEEARRLAGEQARTKIYKDGLVKIINSVINQQEILRDNNEGLISLSDIRINKFNGIKATITPYLYIQEFQILNQVLDSEIKFIENLKAISTGIRPALQEAVNISNIFLNDFLLSRKELTENDFNQAYQSLQLVRNDINESWGSQQNAIKTFKERADRDDADLKTIFNLIKQRYNTSPYSYQVPPESEIYYTPQQYNFLEYYYQQRQHEMLNNISEDIDSIARSLRNLSAPPLLESPPPTLIPPIE